MILGGNGVEASCLRDLSPVYEQGKTYFEHEQYLLATEQFSLFSLMSCSQNDKDRGRLRWAQSLFELSEFSEGNNVISKLGENSRYKRAAGIVQAWYQPDYVSMLPTLDQNQFQEWHKDASSIPRPKNPWVAGGLSALLPGAGQVYNGTYQSAAFAFILNALFLSAAIDFQRHNLSSAALTSGVLFSVVYAGNIFGAVHTSQLIDEKYAQPKEDDLKQRLFPELMP